jgi:hypothetical protein
MNPIDYLDDNKEFVIRAAIKHGEEEVYQIMTTLHLISTNGGLADWSLSKDANDSLSRAKKIFEPRWSLTAEQDRKEILEALAEISQCIIKLQDL